MAVIHPKNEGLDGSLPSLDVMAYGRGVLLAVPGGPTGVGHLRDHRTCCGYEFPCF